MDEEFFRKEVHGKNLDKKAALAAIAREIEQSAWCKEQSVGKAVPGEGNPDAKVVFVGEAPGKKEAATGRPFVGRSGNLLRRAMEDIGLSPQEVFITSVGKYLPIKGKPTPEQIVHCRPYLLRQLDIIHPHIVVLLGATAVQGVLQGNISVKKLHGTTREDTKRIYFITVHPAAALRFQVFREIFFADFAKLKELMRNE